tara:strand:- start:218 stop:460 length:243 start_codon:yes stop_codon:yes gene_type:complete
MAVTIENRPHVMGDLVMFTATCESGDTAADFSDLVSDILMAQVQATDGTATALTAAINGGTAIAWTNLGRAGRISVLGKR